MWSDLALWSAPHGGQGAGYKQPEGDSAGHCQGGEGSQEKGRQMDVCSGNYLCGGKLKE